MPVILQSIIYLFILKTIFFLKKPWSVFMECYMQWSAAVTFSFMKKSDPCIKVKIITIPCSNLIPMLWYYCTVIGWPSRGLLRGRMKKPYSRVFPYQTRLKTGSFIYLFTYLHVCLSVWLHACLVCLTAYLSIHRIVEGLI